MEGSLMSMSSVAGKGSYFAQLGMGANMHRRSKNLAKTQLPRSRSMVPGAVPKKMSHAAKAVAPIPALPGPITPLQMRPVASPPRPSTTPTVPTPRTPFPTAPSFTPTSPPSHPAVTSLPPRQPSSPRPPPTNPTQLPSSPHSSARKAVTTLPPGLKITPTAFQDGWATVVITYPSYKVAMPDVPFPRDAKQAAAKTATPGAAAAAQALSSSPKTGTRDAALSRTVTRAAALSHAQRTSLPGGQSSQTSGLSRGQQSAPSGGQDADKASLSNAPRAHSNVPRAAHSNVAAASSVVQQHGVSEKEWSEFVKAATRILQAQEQSGAVAAVEALNTTAGHVSHDGETSMKTSMKKSQRDRTNVDMRNLSVGAGEPRGAGKQGAASGERRASHAAAAVPALAPTMAALQNGAQRSTAAQLDTASFSTRMNRAQSTSFASGGSASLSGDRQGAFSTMTGSAAASLAGSDKPTATMGVWGWGAALAAGLGLNSGSSASEVQTSADMSAGTAANKGTAAVLNLSQSAATQSTAAQSAATQSAAAQSAPAQSAAAQSAGVQSAAAQSAASAWQAGGSQNTGGALQQSGSVYTSKVTGKGMNKGSLSEGKGKDRGIMMIPLEPTTAAAVTVKADGRVATAGQGTGAVRTGLPGQAPQGARQGERQADLLPLGAVNYSGLWDKDMERSQLQEYEKALDLLKVSGLQKLTARLIEGLEIQHASNLFSVRFVTIVPYFKVTEIIKAGPVQQLPRRDLRAGTMNAAAERREQAIVINTSWPDPLAGSMEEVYEIQPDGTELHVLSTLTIGAETRAVRQVFHRKA